MILELKYDVEPNVKRNSLRVSKGESTDAKSDKKESNMPLSNYRPANRLRIAQRPGLALRNRNVLGPQNTSNQFGWMGPALTQLANTKRTALSLVQGNNVMIVQAFPLVLAYSSPMDLLGAARIATAGKGEKVTAQTTHTAVADLDLTLTGTIAFGVKVRVTDSPLNFRFGAYRIQLLNGATVVSEVIVQANKMPAEVILLAISNTGGQATVVGITNPIVRFPFTNSAVTTTLVCWAETLNMRDVGEVVR